MYKKNITIYIKKAVIKSYSQDLLFKASYNNFESRIIEYIITVNIAQYLINWNKKHNYMFSIYLEYDSNKFCRNAFFSSIIIDNGIYSDSSYIYRSDIHNSMRKGRIDIVITEKLKNGQFDEECSIIGIEVKPIVKNLIKIKDDIIRLQHAMLNNDNVSENKIQNCYVVFLKRLDSDLKVLDEIKYQNKISNLRNQISNLFSKINIINTLEFDCEVFPINKLTIEEFSIINKDNDLIDYSNALNETGAVVGVLISMSRL